MWANCLHGHFYKNIEPNVSPQIKFEDKNRKKEVTIGRLRLGKCTKCYTNQYLAMGIVGSDKFPECCSAVETVEYFLLQCPQSDLCKDVLSVCKQLQITTTTMENILTHDKIVDVIFYKKIFVSCRLYS